MNFELSAPTARISLSTSAVVVNVEVNVWTATKQDRSISNEVTTAKNASADAGRFTKNLLANCPQHKALLNYRQTVYNWMQRLTFDWAGSARILPHVSLPKFKAEYDAHEREFGKLLDEFVAVYPSLVSDAAFKQGDMFDRSDYPDVSEIRGKFRVKLFVTKVPENDFRSGEIADAIVNDLKQHYEQQVSEIVDNIMEDAAERFLSIASRLRNSCEEAQPDDTGKVKRKKVYETTVTQAREIAKTLQGFNLTNNAALREACVALENTLSGVSMDDLRESSYVRQTVKSDIDDILSKFAPLGGGV
jgi:hypothetical protein